MQVQETGKNTAAAAVIVVVVKKKCREREDMVYL